jgi:hypothetical protein
MRFLIVRILFALIIALGLLGQIRPSLAQAPESTPTPSSTATPAPTLTPSPATTAEITAAAAQASNQWSQPKSIFSLNGNIQFPTITADGNGNFYAFWRYVETAAQDSLNSQPLDSQIYLAVWDGQAWSQPNDILSASELYFPSAVADDQGQLHLLVMGSLNTYLYTSTETRNAASAAAWSKPVQLLDGNPHASITLGPDGELLVVIGRTGNNGVALLRSKDNGKSWSDPIYVTPPLAKNASADFPKLVIGKDGVYHLVWTEFQYPAGFPPLGIYYSRSVDQGASWSDPFQLAGNGYTQVNLAVSSSGEVFTAWNGMAGIQGRYFRLSKDNGFTWAEVETIPSRGVSGSDGQPQLALDAQGQLHLTMTDAGCVWYTSRDSNGSWSYPLCVSRATHIEQAAMAVSRGNLLGAVFWHDEEGNYSLFSSFERLALEPLPIPTSRATAGFSATASPQPSGTPTSRPAPANPTGSAGGKGETSLEIGQILLIGLLPTFVLLGGLIGYHFWRQNRPR